MINYTTSLSMGLWLTNLCCKSSNVLWCFFGNIFTNNRLTMSTGWISGGKCKIGAHLLQVWKCDVKIWVYCWVQRSRWATRGQLWCRTLYTDGTFYSHRRDKCWQTRTRRQWTLYLCKWPWIYTILRQEKQYFHFQVIFYAVIVDNGSGPWSAYHL